MEDENLTSTEEELDEAKQLTPEEIAKRDEEKRELLENVLSGNIKTLKEKVGYVLNRYSDTRNSDIELAWQYWATFQNNIFNGTTINKAQLNALTRIGSLVRSRAKIQNEYKLFEADPQVKRYRGVLEEEKKNEAVEDKPSGLPSYTVFIDETGKNQTHLCVGSLWIVQGGLNSYHVKTDIDQWKKQNEIEYEFHFSEVSRNKIQSFKDFFIKFLSLNPTAGFKIISVRNSGFRDVSQPITDLTFHLLNSGIQHENSSNRAPLPRILQVWLDEEEEGSDSLKLENLKERITAQNIEGLYIDNFHAVSSKSNYFIQAVDLFAAAVNRKINVNSANPNHKDDLADFILGVTNFDISSIDTDNSNTDNSVVFNLSDFSSE